MYTFFYKRLKISKKIADNKVYVLSNEELLELAKIERRAIFLSALIGAAMVLLLYLPQYYYAAFFAESHFVIPYFDFAFDLSVWALVYGLILVFIEIVLLTLLHIYCAHRTAVASGFIDENTKLNEDKLLVLLNVGKETKNKKILQLGINPYQGLSKRSVFVMNLFFTLKATLSNLLVRIFVKRILGRYALREVLDMMGIPVFAFWNAFATHKVLTEARLIIMGSNLINDLKNKLPQLNLSEAEKEVLYDALQLVAMNKRDFHDNHYFLAKMVLEFYNIPFKKEHVCSADFIDKLSQQRPEVKRCCEFILLVGFILDGHISWREKKKINTMHDKKILTESVSDIQQLAINFKKGKGIEDLEKRYL